MISAQRRWPLFALSAVTILFLLFDFLNTLSPSSLGGHAFGLVSNGSLSHFGSVQPGLEALLNLSPQHGSLPLSLHHVEGQSPWLIATSMPYHGIQRRQIIRSTWQALYANVSLFTPIFVVCHPEPIWQPVIDAENEKYKDIVQLDWLEETGHVANTVKSVEFLKAMAGWYGKRAENKSLPWRWVSKIDDDSYLDVPRFWEKFLLPLRNDTARDDIGQGWPQRTIFGRILHKGNFSYPGGQFYTLSADMVDLVARLHDENPITDEHEDVLVGRLLAEADEPWKHIDLPNMVAFDYKDEDLWVESRVLARPDDDLSGWAHAVGKESINPHKMRDDKTYLQVASEFDSHGVRYSV